MMKVMRNVLAIVFLLLLDSALIVRAKLLRNLEENEDFKKLDKLDENENEHDSQQTEEKVPITDIESINATLAVFQEKEQGVEFDEESQNQNIFQAHSYTVDYYDYCMPIQFCNLKNVEVELNVKSEVNSLGEFSAYIPTGGCVNVPCTKNNYFYYYAKDKDGPWMYSSCPPNLCYISMPIKKHSGIFTINLDFSPKEKLEAKTSAPQHNAESCIPVFLCNKHPVEVDLFYKLEVDSLGSFNAKIPVGTCVESPCTKNHFYYYTVLENMAADPNLPPPYSKVDVVQTSGTFYFDLQ